MPPTSPPSRPRFVSPVPAREDVADPRLRADPLADDAMARILGEWNDGTPRLSRWEALASVERALAGWETNGALAAWRPEEGTPAPIAAALEDYLQQARRLPDWVDAGKIGCAESVFAGLGTLAIALPACAGLPESVMAPDPLEQAPGERLRAAAALQDAALGSGGLLAPHGAGLAQVLRLRLMNAALRHLVVRGNPGEALDYGAAIPALLPEGAGPWRALFARGWDLGAHGLPCNQEALAHALLTRHYVFLRSLRRLGLGLNRQEERSWLHAWNLVGHLLGIDAALLPATMKEAAALFARLRRGAHAGAKTTDPRPARAAVLMQALGDATGARAWKPLPVLLARRLCDPATVRVLGLDNRVSRPARALFALGMGAARVTDTAARLLCPGLSLRRLAVRMLGDRLALRFLADPAGSPDWQADPAAPRWVNAVERRLRPALAVRMAPARGLALEEIA
jgi:hypothetical protein